MSAPNTTSRPGLARRRRAPRGFSLIEAMIAGGILILGLTGITLMLTRGAANARNGQQMMDSALVVDQVLADFQANGVDSLVASSPGLSFDAGTAEDGGIYYDASGRVYAATYIVTDVTPAVPPATLLVPTFNVAVEVSYRDAIGTPTYKRGTTILSRAPDAG